MANKSKMLWNLNGCVINKSPNERDSIEKQIKKSEKKKKNGKFTK